MSPTRLRTTTAALSALVTGIVLSGALAGCSTSGPDRTAPRSSSREEGAQAPEGGTSTAPSPTPSPDSSADPSAGQSAGRGGKTSPGPAATTTGASGSKATPSSRPLSLAAALLDAPEMPRLNPASRWVQRHTGPAGVRYFGLCQKFDLLSIGATSVVERSFVTGSNGHDTAGQQVAVFPDAQNTVRAGKVVEAWHRDCAGRVRGDGVRVRPLSDVSVPSGRAWWYLVSYERRGTGHFHSLGVALSGNRMTLVRMDHDGQDHNYGVGKDPTELAVKAASAKLG